MLWSAEEHDQVLDGVSRLGWLVLKRFSALYRPSEILAAFACLSDAEFDVLRRLHFGLSAQVRHFLDEEAPTFLRSMPTTTEHVLEDSHGLPRARIDWARTLSRRSQLGGDVTRFVTRPIERTNDSGAARLIAFVLRRIAENAEQLEKRDVPESAKIGLLNDAMLARRHLGALKGRGARIPSSLTSRDVAPFRGSRREDVLCAVAIYDLFVNLVEQANGNLLKNLLREGQLAPESQDDLFEVWSLLTLVELHLNEGWMLREAHLIGGEAELRRPKFELSKGDSNVEISYQTLPKGASEDQQFNLLIVRTKLSCFTY